jgi:IS1 family transposase
MTLLTFTAACASRRPQQGRAGHIVSYHHDVFSAGYRGLRYIRATTSTKTPLPAATGSGVRTPDGGPSSTRTAQHGPPFGGRQGSIVNVLSDEKRLRVFAALVDGNSTRAIERMTDVHQRTIRKLALSLGEGAQRFHNKHVRNLRPSLLALDEVWSFVAKKQARVTASDPAEYGEAYTFVGIEPTWRLAISWCVGKRNQATADEFTADLRSRVVVMPQITTDGFQAYVSAVGQEFGPGVDFAQTVKNYHSSGRRDDDHRYEPPRGIDFITKKIVYGAPDLDKASTALVERLNGTTRHFVGRMRRLSYAFSKTLAGHKAAMALHYTHYNYCHVVRTLRVTPAVQAGLTDHVWELGELMEALLAAEPCARPEKVPLEHRAPEGPARALPNGRGFLRLVGGAGGPSPAPVPPTPAPAPALAVAAAEPSGLRFDESGQADLFSWSPKPRPLPPLGAQLSLFGEEGGQS